jgi:hypothetical protein
MTTWSIAGRESALSALGRKFAALSARFRAVLLVVIRLCLQLAGFVLLSVAAFGVAWELGVAVAGFSCFVFEWLVKR